MGLELKEGSASEFLISLVFQNYYKQIRELKMI